MRQTELSHDSLSAVHEFSVRGYFFVLTNVVLAVVRTESLIVSTRGRFENDAIPLALIGQLPESGPVLYVPGRQDSVSHLRLVFLSLVAIAEAPTGGAHILRIIVCIVIN